MPQCKYHEVCGLDVEANEEQEEDGQPVYLCILHSQNADKSTTAFQQALTRHRLDHDRRYNFAHIVFPVPADFRFITFSQVALFRDATFSKEVLFHGTRFTNRADFSGARFADEVSFESTEFSEGATFRRAMFSGNVKFGSATFLKEVDFSFGTFNKETHFSSATFSRGVDFSLVTFLDAALFLRVAFSGRVNFGASTFTKEVSFLASTFSEEANFSYATFAGATFIGTSFTGLADFSSATFTGRSLFSNARFLTRAVFASVTFGEGAEFFNVTFTKKVEFQGARIFGATHFAPIKVGSTVRRVFADVEVDLRAVTTYPPNALAITEADFSKALLLDSNLRQIQLTGVKWATIGQRFQRLAVYDDVAPLREGAVRPWSRIEQVYRQLKQNHEEQRDYRRAGDFHYGEKEMLRQNPETPWSLLLFLTLYRTVSGYGERVLRPLVWAVSLLAGATVGYLFCGISVRATGIPLAWKDSAEVVLFGVQAMAFLRPQYLEPLTFWGRTLYAIQSLLGPLLLGLFALAVRQKLRR